MNNFNLNYAIECVKTLADNNRCETCDKLIGPVIRYPCGHCICKSCVLYAEDCLRCLSPPKTSTNFTDVPYSQRIIHASELLSTFQDFFKIDVYKRHRLSEQLKLEKQLFPECIQAPLRYCNKRKSSSVTKNKENLRETLLPGEIITNALKMEQSMNNVQQWLNKNKSSPRTSYLPRKPFEDLNVNGQIITRDQSNLFNKENIINNSRKRTHVKILNSSKKNNFKPKAKKKKNNCDLQNRLIKDLENTGIVKSKCENDESGIFVDENTIIEDSQSEYVDKDKLTFIAVKEAEELHSPDISNCRSIEDDLQLNNFSIPPMEIELIKSNVHRIPFYKKGLLYKICCECTKNDANSKDVIVTIDSKNFTTTITFSQNVKNNTNSLISKSVKVQTDDIHETDIINNSEKAYIKNNSTIFSSQTNQKSDNLHIDKMTKSHVYERAKNNLSKKKDAYLTKRAKCVVIEDSDSDSDVINNGGSNLVISAEVHRSFDDIGVLSTLDENELENRTRHAAREHTPFSTDSSDKENYDPNRIKRQKVTKKYCIKK